MSKVKIEFKTDGDLFSEEDYGEEVANVLRAVAEKFESGKTEGTIQDGSGRMIGRFSSPGRDWSS